MTFATCSNQRNSPLVFFALTAGFVLLGCNASVSSSETQDTQHSVLDLFPDSGLRSDAVKTSCSFTYAPSGSEWTEGVDEKQAFLASIQGANWRLGVGKGGHIYSLRGPYGESVPPQRVASPWNDEVWQAVITSEVLADPIHQFHGENPGVWGDVFPLLCFIHQAGIYVKKAGDGAPAPFYSPCLRKRWNPETKTLELVSWMQQANAPCVWKSYVLIYTAFRDLGQGTIEVNQVLHSFGGIPLDYLSTPWGGVRKSSLPHTIIAKADGTWAEEEGLWNWDNVPERRLPQSGGWAAWVQDPNKDASPALAMVFGNQHVQGTEDRPADLVDVAYRVEGERKILWGTAGGKNDRDYEAAEQVTKLAVRPGESYSIRWFLISGNFADVRKTASKLSGQAGIKSISFDAGAIQSVWLKDGKLSTEGSGDRWARLLAFPVEGSVPVFLLEHKPTGQQVVTADPYALAPSEPFKNPLPKDHPEFERYQNRRVFKPYSPDIGYENLLGYAYAQKPSDRPVRRIETPEGINLHTSAQSLWVPE